MGAASTAHGAAFQLELRTEAQVSQMQAYRGTDPNNPVLLPRRELVQYLNLNVYELVTGQDLGFETSLRVFADLGMSPQEAAMLDGVRAEGADLLYANVHYRAGGLEAVLGRQIYVDFMDYMAFDGLRLKYVLPFGLGAEAYGGLWVKGSSLFSSSVYQPDGTRDTDARRLALAAVPTDAQLTDIEPVVGGKVLLQSFHGFSATGAFRLALLGGATDYERGSLEVKYGKGLGFHASAGAEYDLISGQLSQFRAEARYDHPVYGLSAEALRISPVLSSESIWYYFANGPRDEGRVRLDVTPALPLRFYVQGVVAQYETVINSTLGLKALLTSATPPPDSVNYGGGAGTAFHAPHVRSGLDVTYRDGYDGRQVWVDLHGGVFADHDAYSVDARFSLADVRDGLNPLLRGTFLGAQVWGGYAITSALHLSLVLEENVNPYTKSDTKAFLVFDVKAWL